MTKISATKIIDSVSRGIKIPWPRLLEAAKFLGYSVAEAALFYELYLGKKEVDLIDGKVAR